MSKAKAIEMLKELHETLMDERTKSMFNIIINPVLAKKVDLIIKELEEDEVTDIVRRIEDLEEIHRLESGYLGH